MEQDFLLYSLSAAAIGYCVKLLIQVAINRKIFKNQLAIDILNRLKISVDQAVVLVNQTVKKEILKAKDPSSPGGASITIEEATRLKNAVWQALKNEYGGLSGLLKFVGPLVSINPDREVATKQIVDGLIENKVNELNGGR